MMKLKKVLIFVVTLLLGVSTCLAAEFNKVLNLKTGDVWRLKGAKAQYQVSNSELASCDRNGVVMLRPGDVIITANVALQGGEIKTLKYLVHIVAGEGASALPAKGVPENFQIEVICRVNEERAKYRLGPLRYSQDLDKASQIRAKEIAQTFSHTRPDGTYVFALVSDTGKVMGENIAAGQSTPETVVEAWMNSHEHRENILQPDYKESGVGCYYDPKGTENCRIYWVQLFRG